MRVTTDDGVGIEVDRRGDGPPLVMVHGFTGAKEDFADHAGRFAEHASVVTFDHRGHGASDKPDDVDAYSLDRLASDTIAVLDALELDRVRLLGHSMGGMVARRLVLAHPERVEALVLMDTSHGPPRGIEPELALVAGEVALTEGMDALRALVDEVRPLGTEADERLRAERPGYVEFGDRKWDATAPAAYAGLARAIVLQPDQLDAMRSIACPTLVVVGEQDTPFLDDSEAMAATVPGATLRVIADAGHSPQFEAPEPWFLAVDGFVRSVTDGVVA
jgi:pimeloyl-ACP methyl ester carboxylesterase